MELLQGLDTYELARTASYAIFVIFIPAIIIYLRIRKKFTTGFGVGLILTSILVGVLTAATIYPPPDHEFFTMINTGERDEAKKQLQIMVQQGPEYLASVDWKKVTNRELLRELQQELIAEYTGIARKYYEEKPVPSDPKCVEFVEFKERVELNGHAITLLEYARSLGYEGEDYYEELQKRTREGRKVLEELDDRCH